MIDYKKEEAKIITISAKEALFLLSLNTENRKVSMNKVFGYINDLENNKFLFNGESIIISADGILLDGQHRLMALSKTNLKMKCVLVTGICKNVMSTIDTGSKRNGADILSMHNIPHSTVLAAMSKLITFEFGLNKQYIKGTKKSEGKIVSAQINRTWQPADILADVVKNKEKYLNAIHFAESIYTSKANVRLKGLSVSSISAYYVLFSRDNAQMAKSFLREILTGNTERESNVCIILRNKLINLNLKRENISMEKLRDFMISGFEKYKSGSIVKTLLSKQGSFYKLES